MRVHELLRSFRTLYRRVARTGGPAPGGPSRAGHEEGETVASTLLTNGAERSPDVLSDFLVWLNRRFGKGGAPIEENTRIFEDGRIDSMAVLHLIAWVESVSGTTIPDRLIRIEHFETPAAIVERFFSSCSAAER